MTTTKMIQVHKDDPKKPYKAIAAGVFAVASQLLFLDIGLPVWVKIVLVGIVAAGAAYGFKNPKMVNWEKKKPQDEKRPGAHKKIA